MLKVGTLWAGSRTTCSPFFNVASSARGSFTFRTSLLTGALPLMAAPFVVCWCCGTCAPPWANAKDDTSAISMSERIKLVLFMILIAITPLLSRRAGCGLGRRLRHGDYNGSVCVEQILVRYTLHILFSDRFDFGETIIDQARIVVVDRVLPEQNRSEERRLHLIDQVSSRGVLCLLQLPVGDGLFLQTLDLSVDHCFNISCLHAWSKCSVAVEGADAALLIHETANIRDHLFFFDKLLVQA